ncbi:hypothetical protein [Maritimibacter sp. DP1N21-5]|uniref:hypothetical protein n=1 Tax=Maritimibacter sp. DP1N21-5 TaxID=2836867 RepID=UPI001C468A9D|nr:hypothetical protein [Maritimibacter sp. DP1N21-5]MBV7409147.1 hypothetical protein [Maritimibacter sp. DP1N21-5]
MHRKMRFALVSAGLLFLLPLLLGILKASVFWLFAVLAVFVFNAILGATRVKRFNGIKGILPILGTQTIMIVIFYLIGRFVNLVAVSGDRVELTPMWFAIFAVIAIAAIGTGLVASAPEKADAAKETA